MSCAHAHTSFAHQKHLLLLVPLGQMCTFWHMSGACWRWGGLLPGFLVPLCHMCTFWHTPGPCCNRGVAARTAACFVGLIGFDPHVLRVALCTCKRQGGVVGIRRAVYMFSFQYTGTAT